MVDLTTQYQHVGLSESTKSWPACCRPAKNAAASGRKAKLRSTNSHRICSVLILCTTVPKPLAGDPHTHMQCRGSRTAALAALYCMAKQLLLHLVLPRLFGGPTSEASTHSYRLCHVWTPWRVQLEVCRLARDKALLGVAPPALGCLHR